MTIIRVDDKTAEELREFGKSYARAVDYLIQKTKTQRLVDYDKIRLIIREELKNDTQ